jgi:hypothetical protein
MKIEYDLDSFAFVLLMMASCAATAGDSVLDIHQVFNSGRLVDSKNMILKTSHPADVEMCKGFSLNENQIRSFFRRADQVPSEGFTEYYDWAPCEVQGHFLYGKTSYPFSINAANTGTIELAPGKFVYFACEKKCRDIFDYGYGTSGD